MDCQLGHIPNMGVDQFLYQGMSAKTGKLLMILGLETDNTVKANDFPQTYYGA